MGNLTVYPGSHYQLQNYFRVYGFEDLYIKGVQGLPQLDFTSTQPIQIRARAGDAIILNYSTAHNIAPNISPFIRYTVYFRLTRQFSRSSPRMIQSSVDSTLSSLPSPSTMKHRPEAMLNVWSDWSGIQRMPFYQVDNPNQNVIAIERNSPQQMSPKLPSPVRSLPPPPPPQQQPYQQSLTQYQYQQQRPYPQPYQQSTQQQQQQQPQYQYQQPTAFTPFQQQQQQAPPNRTRDEDEEMRQLAMVLERSKYDK